VTAREIERFLHSSSKRATVASPWPPSRASTGRPGSASCGTASRSSSSIPRTTFRSEAPAGGSSSRASRASASGSGRGRRSRSSIEIRPDRFRILHGG